MPLHHHIANALADPIGLLWVALVLSGAILL